MIKKYSKEYEELKQNILQKFVQPFIAAIECSAYKSLKKEIIQETLICFEKAKDNFEDVSSTLGNHPTLFKDATLKAAYIKFYEFYKSISKEKNQQNSTIVQELLFEIINLFPEFSPIQNQIPQIVDRFDSRTKHNFLEATYNINPHQNTQEEVYYAVTKPILITRTRRLIDAWYHFYDMVLRDKISKEELIEATKYEKGESFELFKSLHDAINYAHLLQKGGKFFDHDQDGIMPAVMMVARKKDCTSTLEFEDQIIKLYSDPMSDLTKHIWISKATVTVDEFIPLAAISLYSELLRFGSYHVFNIQMRLNPPPTNFQTLNERIDLSFGILVDKASDLLNRGFKNEGDKLLAFKNNLEKSLLKLHDELKSNQHNYQGILNQFTGECNSEFEKIKKEFNHSRDCNHLIAEAFLSVCTGGFYAIAMLINKIINHKFSFFSTDTVNKLGNTQKVVNDYLESGEKLIMN